MVSNIASPALTLVPGTAPRKTSDPSKIHEAAQQFESLLVGELLKSSREAGGSGWLGTDEEEAGQTGIEMGEQQLAQMIASSGGLGISRMIERGLKADSAKVATLVCLAALALIPCGRAAQTDTPPTARDRQLEAAAKQRAAAQLQSGATAEGSFFSAGWTSPATVQAPTPNCPAMDPSASDPLIAEAASQNKLNPDLLKAVIREESGFRPCVVSEKGAMGLMQLMPDTAQFLKTGDPFDPAQNIESGARYLRQMLTRFKGDIRLALAAYNAGPERVDGPAPAVPDIRETRDYVDRIVKALNGAPAETAK